MLKQDAASSSVSSTAPGVGTPDAQTKLMLVDFRNGEMVDRHPDIASFVRAGWRIRSATPRIVESQGTKLLVILEQRLRPH